ncbi:MAG: formate dehydrogenase subunit alpha [Anaerolineaceae bacterium]|nr:formate dehydrogenase subunit alpha [Anaerolineaceae bacterium]
MFFIFINGKPYQVREDITLLRAAQDLGIPIPSLCDHPDLTPYGGCRLCDVEVKGLRLPAAACMLPVTDGMEVFTDTEALVEARKGILELLLVNYYDRSNGKNAPPNALMKLCRTYGVEVSHWMREEPRYEIDSDPNPFIRVDLNKCILCTRCVRACGEIQGRFVWGLAERGFDNRIIAGSGVPLLEARCESCGVCVEYCPTGALAHKPSFEAEAPDKKVTTTCAYCGVGCNFDLNVKDNRVVKVTSNPNAVVNGVHLCVKGRYGYQYIHHPDRLRNPQVRAYLLDGSPKPPAGESPWVTVSWDTALDITARKLVDIKRESGPDAIGLLSSAKCTNEENYLMNKLARQVIGTHNVDHCARLCHSSTVSGLAMSFGSGAMTNTMDDIVEHSEAIMIIGSNTTEQHPVIGSKIRQAVLRRKVKLIVADPRRIDIAEFAQIYLRQKPGTDVALINGLMHIILKNNWQDQAFIDERCENFEAFRAVVEEYPPDRVAQITGVSEKDIYRTAELMAQSKPMAVFWAMGITQHTTGVLNVLTLANLQMLLGNMGIPGGGVNPLRGQNNVQGACDMGGLPNVFPGYQPVTNEAVLEKFTLAWQTTQADGSTAPLFNHKAGLTSTEMIPSLATGQVRALVILGENPLVTDPDVNHTRKCMEAGDFIVVQEIFPSDTSQYADVLLPGVTFAEKDGTFTNTERRVQLVRQAVLPEGEARPDWEILADLARRILDVERRTPTGAQAGWDYTCAAEIMDEIAAVTPSYGGVSHARLDAGKQLHWPVKDKNHAGTPILHIGTFTRGAGKFHPTEHLEPKELPDAEYPFLMTTGRVLYHWHAGEMSRRSRRLLEVYPAAYIEINPEDAEILGIHNEQQVRLTSRRGETRGKALVTERVSKGLVFGNFHFADDQNSNNLTIAALDPIAKIPEYKVCAVKLESVPS